MYGKLDGVWENRAALLNARLTAAALPVRVAGLSSIWTVFYAAPSRYNWMLQYYLRAAGIALSWVGTGRLIFSLDFTDEDFAAVSDRFVQACKDMRADGWWWNDGATNRSIRRAVLLETVKQGSSSFLKKRTNKLLPIGARGPV